MDRRAFVRTLAGILAAARFDAGAQPADRLYKVGILRPTAPPKSGDRVAAEFLLPAALAKLGYAEGRNLIVEWRYAKGEVQRVPALAHELVQMRVDVIVAIAAAAALAAKKATATIPIIFFSTSIRSRPDLLRASRDRDATSPACSSRPRVRWARRSWNC